MSERFYSGGFLFNRTTHAVLLHKRDGNTKINPNKWAFFGGLNENNEDPVDCLIREVHEELNLDVERCNVIPLRDYLNKDLNTYRHVFYIESDVDKSKLILGEGADFDWISLDQLKNFDLTDKTKDDLEYFIATVR